MVWKKPPNSKEVFTLESERERERWYYFEKNVPGDRSCRWREKSTDFLDLRIPGGFGEGEKRYH